MESVGTQVRLPFRGAFTIAAQGIRIRLGRSLVTLSGVVLGIAFLMSSLMSQLIRTAVAHESEARQTVNLMESLVKGEVGNLQEKILGVAVFGALSDHEKMLLERLRAEKAGQLRAAGLAGAGLAPCGVKEVGNGASLVLVLGAAADAPVSVADLTAGMTEKVVLDSVSARTFAGRAFAAEQELGIRRELFFGKVAEERTARLRVEEQSRRYRTIWIAVFSLLVTVIGIANALLMSVTERFREIGTMKCLGALSSFIRRLFLIESTIIGLTGSILGTIVGVLLPVLAFGWSFGFGLVLGSLSYVAVCEASAFCVVAGTILAMLAAIYPATFASRMVPASALRSNV